ncbi:aquaporin Z [Hallerella succinigenes]|uniref:MIP family channel proteins n=1 Tax=Hallerella succinigenes TaxID=1896222 RepID=A0A2M9A5S5_9BACT|nr:aquaporin Z [Hallerella succinigenes]MDD6092682.1 aquaporin Z [Hallerella succinigenes]PJJ41075.1 MIP family channel proteins [Hallerella succinigenes]
MTLLQRSIAEAIGTFWLVFGGCGAAVLACGVPNTGIGYVGVSLAFGLTVLTMAYAIGHISGCHLNPAVTLGQVAGGRFPAKEAPAYIIAQVIGGIIAAAVLYIIASPDLSAGIGAFATNGWSDMANANGLNAFGGKVFGMGSAFLIEMVLTAVFLFVIMGATDGRAPAGFAPIAIGLCLTLIHLISIPATNTSVNPARSTAVAVFVGGMALKQLWLFWVAPILGGVIGGVAYKVLAEKKCCCGDKCCCEKKEEA